MLKRTITKTLDTQHNIKLQDFQKQHDIINQKNIELTKIIYELNELSESGLSNLSHEEFIKYMDLTDMKNDLEKNISSSRKSLDEIDYYIDTADIIFKYYDIVENGNILENEAAHVITENSILKFFSQSSDNSKQDKERKDDDRASLLEKYMECTDDNYMKSMPQQEIDMCPSCESKNRTLLVNDGLMYCNDCHTIETVIIDHEKPSYKDPPKEISYFSYKRLNHLNEWISQIQGKESTDIPTDVYDRILLEINKQRITNMAEITPAKIKAILKALRLNKFYEHTPHIINRLNGAPTPNFTPEIEEKLRQMFKMIQIPFFNHAPKNRKNFLSYSYTIHKCLQLLELDEYLKFFPLLRSREKTFAMDQVWKKICHDLGWDYIPSL